MGDMADMLSEQGWDEEWYCCTHRNDSTCNRCGKRIWWYEAVVGNKLVWRPHNQTGSRMHVCRIDPKKEFDNLDALDKDGVPLQPDEVVPRVP